MHGYTFVRLTIEKLEGVNGDLVRTDDEGPMLETLDYTIRIGSTPTILYFDFYLYCVHAAHYVYKQL